MPGTEISELLPLEAKITDKFSIVRGLKSFSQDHVYHEVATGFPADGPSAGVRVDRQPAQGDWRRGDAGFRLAAHATSFANVDEVEQPHMSAWPIAPSCRPAKAWPA